MSIFDRSFKARTIAVVWVTSTIAALVACGAFLAYDRVTYRDALAHRLEVHSGAAASRTVAAIQFEDQVAAGEILAELEVEADIVGAAIFLPDGTEFARWSRAGGAVELKHGDSDGMHWAGDHALHVEPIQQNSDRLGTLAVALDLVALDKRLKSFSLIILLALAVSLTIAALIASRLQAGLVGPITALAEAAQKVSQDKDYSIRARKVNDDEVGALTSSFNSMLAEIQAQQLELERYSSHLQELVDERTYELAQAMSEVQATALSLRESERRFRSLSSNAPIGIFQVDGLGQLIYANPLVCELTGLDMEMLLTRAFTGLIHEADEAGLAHLWEKMLREHVSIEHTFRMLVGEQIRWVQLSCAPTAAGNGGYIGTASDITARKQAESERARMIQEHLKLSREAGMAEIATSVLHNVGNVLNSVNVSAATVSERLQASNVSDVTAIAELLKEQGETLPQFFAEDPRGAMLPDYLCTIGEVLTNDLAMLVEEIQSLIRNVDHIKKVVSMQQSFARVSGVEEPIHPSELVNEAIELGVTSLERHGVELISDLQAEALITVDKHKVLQILINLIGNAKHAVVDHPVAVKQVTVRSRDLEGGWLRIEVEDTGTGIQSDHLERVFNFGFTTKRNGHGFGLHSSANTAQQLGGTLKAHSDGPGMGALFVLTLPLGERSQPIVSSEGVSSERDYDPSLASAESRRAAS